MQNREDTIFSLVGFFLLSALGFFAWQSDPLESVRPVGEKTDAVAEREDQRVTARLWQDPLFMGSAVPKESQRGRTSGAMLHEEIGAALKKDLELEIKILAVMVNGGPYTELKEQRRRRRYAVLSALGDAGYEPRDPDSLGVASPFCDPKSKMAYEWFDRGKDRALVLWLDESRFAHTPLSRFADLITFVVPSDLGRRTDWIVLGPANSDTLRSLVVATDKGKDALKPLKETAGIRRFRILSPLATASNIDLGRESLTGHTILGEEFSRQCDSSTEVEDPGVQCFQFLRTLNADNVLIDRLVAELVSRQIEPTDAIAVISEWDTAYGRGLAKTLERKLRSVAKDRGDRQHIKLLRFTYERGIDGLVPGAKKGGRLGAGKRNASKGLTDDSEVVRRPLGTGQFDYLRRLSNQLLKKDREIRLSNGRGIRAVAVLGSDVYDKLLVLRALRKKLPGAVWLTTDLDANYIHPGEYKWTRNLVIASSYGLTPPASYPSDKPPFRDSYQTSAYVAASMALNDRLLNEFIEKGSQTPGIYEVGRHGFVRLAEGYSSDGSIPFDPRKGGGEKIRTILLGLVLLAALGFLSLYQLLPHAGQWLVLPSTIILSLFGLFFLGSFFVELSEPFSIVQGISVWPTELIRIFAFFLALYWSYVIVSHLNRNLNRLDQDYLLRADQKAGGSGFQHNLMPAFVSSLQGMVPVQRGKLLVGLVVAVLAVAAVFKATFYVISILSELEQRPRVIALLLSWLLAAVTVWWFRYRRTDNQSPFEQRASENSPIWIYGSLALIFCMFLIMTTMGGQAWPQLDRLIFLGLVWTIVISLWLMFINGRFHNDVKVCSINAWVEDDKERSFLEIWDSYKAYGGACHRVLRALTYAVIYFAFASILFTLLPGGVTPCRGGSCVVDKIVLGFSVLAMLFLLFLVVDAARLCVLWIRKIQEQHPQFPGEVNQAWSGRLGVDEAHVKHWLKIQLIGQQTNSVDRMVYFPVIIVLIMLLARSTFFDNWGFPQALSVVVTLNLIIAFASVMILNYRAKQARDGILKQLRDEVAELQQLEAAEERKKAHDLGENSSKSDLEKLIKDLQDFQLGAYQQIWNQPLVRSAILLVAGAGIAYTEHLSRF